MRVVLDANVVVSGVLGYQRPASTPGEILRRWLAGAFELVIADPLIVEKVRSARKGIEPKERLGRHRWVVERTLAWLKSYRRLTISLRTRHQIHQAFLSLGCALICFNHLPRADGV